MADKQIFTLDGFKEFEDQIKELSANYKRPDLVSRNVLTKAIKRSLEPAYNNILPSIPHAEHITPSSKFDDAGNLKPHLDDSLRIEARIPNDKDKRSAFVMDGDAVIGIISVKKSAVSLSMEFGNARVGAGRPFLTTRFQSSIGSILNILQSELSNLLPAYAAKLNKKGVK